MPYNYRRARDLAFATMLLAGVSTEKVSGRVIEPFYEMLTQKQPFLAHKTNGAPIAVIIAPLPAYRFGSMGRPNSEIC